MSLLLQFSPQFPIVIDFSVTNRPHRFIFVGYGLVASREIDDTQAPHAEGQSPAEIGARVIRPAVNDGRVHFCH